MKITVFGLGAIGSNLLVQLSKQHPEYEFYGVDFDKIEERNIRTQAYFLEQVGMLKADAMRVILSRYNRKPRYTPFRERVITHSPIDFGYRHTGLSIDCFDNTVGRKILKEKHKKGEITGELLHIGFSPDYTAECIWNEDYDVPNDIDAARADICSMGDAVPFIHFVVNAALLNISNWIETGKKRNFIVTGKGKIQWL